MSKKAKKEDVAHRMMQARVNKLSTVEKYFYGGIVFTVVTLALSIVYVQANITAVQSEMVDIKRDIDSKQVELEENKLEINALTQKSRLMDIANAYHLYLNDANLRVAE